MPTTEQYAASIVEKYHIAADPGSAPHRAVDEVVPLLKQWAKQYLLGITLSGDVSEGGKEAIAAAARGALYDENWKKILW